MIPEAKAIYKQGFQTKSPDILSIKQVSSNNLNSANLSQYPLNAIKSKVSSGISEQNVRHDSTSLPRAHISEDISVHKSSFSVNKQSPPPVKTSSKIKTRYPKKETTQNLTLDKIKYESPKKQLSSQKREQLSSHKITSQENLANVNLSIIEFTKFIQNENFKIQMQLQTA